MEVMCRMKWHFTPFLTSTISFFLVETSYKFIGSEYKQFNFKLWAPTRVIFTLPWCFSEALKFAAWFVNVERCGYNCDLAAYLTLQSSSLFNLNQCSHNLLNQLCNPSKIWNNHCCIPDSQFENRCPKKFSLFLATAFSCVLTGSVTVRRQHWYT